MISCVGHEVDFTIADFVADLRAPTPSAAAELVVKNSQNTHEHIADLQKRLLQAIHLFYERAKRRYDLAVNSPVFKRPQTLTQNKEQELDDLTLRLEQAFALRVAYFAQRFEIASQKLNALGPQAVLKRGYSITRKQDGTVISRVNQTQSGEEIYVQVQDGMIYTKVKWGIMATKFNFEKQLSRLEEIVAKLEEEQTDLDASVKLFEEGVVLSKELAQKLETVKFKVEELKKKGAEMITQPFDTDLAENTDGE